MDRAHIGSYKILCTNVRERRANKYVRMMDRWQRIWTNQTKGIMIYEQCMEVSTQQLKTSFKANQLLTGHGNMEAYLMRFRLKQTNGMCVCGARIDTVRHKVYGDLGIQLRRNKVIR